MSASIDRLFGRRVQTADLYRAPSMSGGKRGGTMASVASDLVVKRWPLTTSPGADRLTTVPAAAIARSTHLVYVRQAVAVLAGDELRYADGTTDKVEGVGHWGTTVALAVSEVRRPA